MSISKTKTISKTRATLTLTTRQARISNRSQTSRDRELKCRMNGGSSRRLCEVTARDTAREARHERSYHAFTAHDHVVCLVRKQKPLRWTMDET